MTAEREENVDTSEPGLDEVVAVARGIATAVAPPTGLTDLQSTLLNAVTKAMTDIDVDYLDLEPMGPEELAETLERRDSGYRQRIVHHMVLGELVLTPLPTEVADRVEAAANALGIQDDFVRVARRYAEGSLGLAWCDLRRSGFTDHWDESRHDPLYTKGKYADPFDEGVVDPDLEQRWRAFGLLDEGTLGRAVWRMYRTRGFAFPGAKGGASAYLAQHDFVHVLADYGTNLKGELETFALVGRADPDPKGFAWVATLVGLFETGYVHQQGFLQVDVRERHMRAEGMGVRFADAIRRGKAVCEGYGADLFGVDFHEFADRPVAEVREILNVPPKSAEAVEAGSPGLFEHAGMSEAQRNASGRETITRQL